MTLKNIKNFYDSDFYSRNEFDDTDDLLNIAFIASPDESISCIRDDSSLKEFSGVSVFSYEKYQEIVRNPKANKLAWKGDRIELSCQRNGLINAEEDFRKKSSSESNLEPHSTANIGYQGKNEKFFVSTAKRDWKPKFDRLDSETGILQFSTDLPKKHEERIECILTSTCLDEFQKASEEYDWGRMEKRSFFELDDESEKTEPKIRVSVSNYVYHELSTIPEIDSVFVDESDEPMMNSNKSYSSFVRDSKHPQVLNANGSLEISNKAKAPSKFPAYVMKVIQNEHIEKFLQEPGILEESDLTLISTDFDSLSKISQWSMGGESRHYHSNYKIKHFDEEESPSLKSFLQHELSCTDE